MAHPSIRRSIWILLLLVAVCALVRYPLQRFYEDHQRERLTRESNALAPAEDTDANYRVRGGLSDDQY